MATKRRWKIMRLLIEGLMAIVLFSSCQKEITSDLVSSDSTATGTTTGKVKAYAEYIGSASVPASLADSFNLSYDSKDRLTSLVPTVNSGKFTYTYNSNNTYTLDIYVGNTLSINVLFFLNSYSLVDSTIQSNGTSDTTTEKYIYNSSKQLVTKREIFYYGGSPDITTYNFTYDGYGNVKNETSDNPSTTIAYEYYLDKPNDVNIGDAYFFRNKNLTKTTTTTTSSGTTTAQHTYTFDNSNRQTSEKIVMNTGDTLIKKYYY